MSDAAQILVRRWDLDLPLIGEHSLSWGFVRVHGTAGVWHALQKIGRARAGSFMMARMYSRPWFMGVSRVEELVGLAVVLLGLDLEVSRVTAPRAREVGLAVTVPRGGPTPRGSASGCAVELYSGSM